MLTTQFVHEVSALRLGRSLDPLLRLRVKLPRLRVKRPAMVQHRLDRHPPTRPEGVHRLTEELPVLLLKRFARRQYVSLLPSVRGRGSPYHLFATRGVTERNAKSKKSLRFPPTDSSSNCLVVSRKPVERDALEPYPTRWNSKCVSCASPRLIAASMPFLS